MNCLVLLILGSIGADLPPIPWDDVPKEVASLKARVEKLEQKIKSNRNVPIFKTADWCQNCPAIEQTMKAANYDFQKADPLPGENIPRVEWNGRYVEGNNPLEVLKLLGGDPTAGSPIMVLATHGTAMPMNQLYPEVKTSRVAINYSAPRYTYPGGSVKQHLMEDHGFSEADLAGLSHSDLIALHNTAHTSGSNMSRSGNQRSGPRIFAGTRRLFGGNRRLFRGGGCPGGSCPN